MTPRVSKHCSPFLFEKCTMTNWVDVAGCDEIPAGEMMAIVANGTAIVLVHLNGAFTALRDQCTHGQARLSDGFLEGDCIECPLHQALFDARTGIPKSPPAT